MNADPTIRDILARVDLARKALRIGDYRDLRRELLDVLTEAALGR